MEYFKIGGNKKLEGAAFVHGAKNAVLPILTAAVMIDGEVTIHNCPVLSDVENTVKILRYLGADVKREGSTLVVNSSVINESGIPQNYMREMRSSVLFLGALSSRCKNAQIYLPGGCDIGSRPIDLHLKALADLSGTISFDGNKITCDMKNAASGDIVLPYPSVGATENAILASVFLKGRTRIINAAREPEIRDLCCFLNKAGADIRGASTSFIEIYGVEKLHGTEHSVIPDRILGVTLMCAAAATGSTIEIKNIDITDFNSEIPVLMQTGCKFFLSRNGLIIKPPRRLKGVKRITTKPYPGFSTDCQAPVCAMLTKSKGETLIEETVFENRFRYVNELKKFGANIGVSGSTAYIEGINKLYPADVSCTDLRGGAALVIAALSAQGVSRINNIEHIDRGYEKFEKQLARLGADIVRTNDEKEGL